MHLDDKKTCDKKDKNLKIVESYAVSNNKNAKFCFRLFNLAP